MAAKDVQITLTAIDKASSVIAGIASTAERSFGSIQSVLAGAGMAAPLAAMVKASYDWGNQVQELTERTGMAEDAAGRLLAVGTVVGLSGEDMNTAFMKMSKSAAAAQDAINNAGVGAENTSNVYSKFGIAVQDANNNLLPADRILKNIAARYRELAPGVEKNNMLLEVFGKSGLKFHELLQMQETEIDRISDKFTRLGLASTGMGEKMQKLGFSVNEAKLSFTALEVQLGNQLMPEVIRAIDGLNKYADAYGQLDTNTQAAIASSAKFVAGAGIYKVALASLLPGWLKVAGYIGLATAAMDDWIEKSLEARGYADTMTGESNWFTGQPKYGPVKVGKAGDWEGAGLDTGQKPNGGPGPDEGAKKTLKTAVDLAASLSKVRDSSLQQTLDAIDKETAAFRKAKLSEVDIAKYAELAKTKAVRDAIDQRFGPEVAAAKAAILEGRDPYSDVAKAKSTHEKDDKATYDAKEYVRNLLGVKLPGETVRGLSFEGNTISQTSRTATNVEIPQARPGQPNIFENYRPAEAGKISITVSPNITVSAITPETRRQIQNEMAEGLEQALGRAYNSQVDARY